MKLTSTYRFGSLVSVILLLWAAPESNSQQSKRATPIKDAVTTQFKASPSDGILPNEEATAATFATAELPINLTWDASNNLYKLANAANVDCLQPDPARAYIVHLAQWKVNDDSTYSFSPVS